MRNSAGICDFYNRLALNKAMTYMELYLLFKQYLARII